VSEKTPLGHFLNNSAKSEAIMIILEHRNMENFDTSGQFRSHVLCRLSFLSHDFVHCAVRQVECYKSNTGNKLPVAFDMLPLMHKVAKVVT